MHAANPLGAAVIVKKISVIFRCIDAKTSQIRLDPQSIFLKAQSARWFRQDGQIGDGGLSIIMRRRRQGNLCRQETRSAPEAHKYLKLDSNSQKIFKR